MLCSILKSLTDITANINRRIHEFMIHAYACKSMDLNRTSTMSSAGGVFIAALLRNLISDFTIPNGIRWSERVRDDRLPVVWAMIDVLHDKH